MGGECVPFDFTEEEGGGVIQSVLVALLLLALAVVFRYRPASLLLCALVCVSVLLSLGILTLRDLFANSAGLVAVAALQIASEALKATSGIDALVEDAMLSSSSSSRRMWSPQQARTRLALGSAALAMLVSSQHAREILTPLVMRCAKRLHLPSSASPLLDTLHAAAWFGGYATVLGGVGTNLAMMGLAKEYFCLHLSGLEMIKAGVPIAALLASSHLWREGESSSHNSSDDDAAGPPAAKSSSSSALSSSSRPSAKEAMVSRFHTHFTFDALVPVTFHGKTIEEAGFRNLDGLFLTSARCGNAVFPVVGPDFKLRTGDRISFAGVASKFLSFCNERGLTPVTENDEESYWLEDFTLEAVVSATSDLVGKSMKKVNFRTRYGASVLAIHRVGQENAVKLPQGKLGQVVLQVGDLLLLVVSDAFDWQKPMTRRDLKPRFATTAQAALYFDSQMPSAREYVFTMKVSSQTLANRTVDQAGLVSEVAAGVRLIAVSRGNLTSKGVSPHFALQVNDVLWFAGERDGLLALRRLPALEDVEYLQIQRRNIPPQRRALFEAAVGLHSDLLYKTVKESRFGTRFKAVIVAIQRHQEFSRHFSKIGDVELLPGDVLLVDAEADQFATNYAGDDNFLVISRVEGSGPPRLDRFQLVSLVLACVVLGPVLVGGEAATFALAGLITIMLAGVLPRDRALLSVRFDSLLVLGSFGALGVAVMRTGLAYRVALAVAWLLGPTRELGLLFGICLGSKFAGSMFPVDGGAVLVFLPVVVALGEVWGGVDCARMIVALLVNARAGGGEARADWRVQLGVQLVALLVGFPYWYFSVPASLGVLLHVAVKRDPSLWAYLPSSSSLGAVEAEDTAPPSPVVVVEMEPLIHQQKDD